METSPLNLRRQEIKLIREKLKKRLEYSKARKRIQWEEDKDSDSESESIEIDRTENASKLSIASCACAENANRESVNEENFTSEYAKINTGKSNLNIRVDERVNERVEEVRKGRDMPIIEMDIPQSEEEQEQEEQNSFERPRKTAKVDKSKTKAQQPVTLTNKFGLLQRNDESQAGPSNIEETTRDPPTRRKTTWIPPIVIKQQVVDYKKFTTDIQGILGHTRFQLKFLRDSVKIFTDTHEEHEKLVQELRDTEVDFYSHPRREEKLKKIVLKAAPNMETNEILETIKENNLNAKACVPMKGRSSRPFSYLVSLSQDTKINDVRKMGTIGNLKVTWERYAKTRNWTQCHNCQEFGHGEQYCNRPPRCVKCIGKHNTKNCTLIKTENSKAKCVNCMGDHPANYKKCPALLDYLEKRNILTQQNPNNKKEITINRKQQSENRQRSTQHGQVTYSEAVRGKMGPPTSTTSGASGAGTNDLKSCMSELREINELFDFAKYIKILKQLKNELKTCDNTVDKLTVLLKYVDLFD